MADWFRVSLRAMNALSLLGLSREELLLRWPGLIIHDDSAAIYEDDRAYASHPDGEFEAVFNDGGVVATVFVYRESPLLEGIIPFAATRCDILNRFGTPSTNGEETVLKSLGAQGAWDRFDYREWSIHFQYVTGADRLHLVTFMTSDVAKRLT